MDGFRVDAKSHPVKYEYYSLNFVGALCLIHIFFFYLTMQRISVISLMYSVTYLGIFIAESSCCKREKNMNLTSSEESHYSMMKEVKPENWYVHSTDLAVNCKNSVRENRKRTCSRLHNLDRASKEVVKNLKRNLKSQLVLRRT